MIVSWVHLRNGIKYNSLEFIANVVLYMVFQNIHCSSQMFQIYIFEAIVIFKFQYCLEIACSRRRY